MYNKQYYTQKIPNSIQYITFSVTKLNLVFLGAIISKEHTTVQNSLKELQ